MIVIKILEPIGKEEKLWIQEFQREDVSIEFKDTRNWAEPELIDYIKDAQVLMLANRPLPTSVIERCPFLKLIITAFSGLDHIAIEICHSRMIQVKNTAGYATHAVAELTLCLAIALLREVVKATQSLMHKSLFPLGFELYGKKIGVVGAGAIGREVGRLFSAFGCEVSFFHYRELEDKEIKQIPLDELLRISDIVSLHMPLNKHTRHILSAEKLAMLKPSAYLINTGRGALIEESALVNTLQEKKIAGAALDVLGQEPPIDPSHPLLHMPHVIITPHIGYRTQEAAICKADLAVNHLREWLVSAKDL